MNYIFYQTKTYFTNTGDALINRALIEMLRNYGNVYANCGEDVPADFLDMLGIQPEERIASKNEFQFIQKIIRCAISNRKTGDRTYVFSGPGDMYGGGIRLVVRNLASGLVFPFFRLAGVRIIRIGRSVGPVSKLMAISERIRSIFLSEYYVRDSLSLRNCHKMGIRKVKQCPDLSWIYDMDHPTRMNQTNVVMVNLRNAIFDDIEQPFIDATLLKCEELLTSLTELLDSKIKVCVAYQTAEEREFSKVVFEGLKEKFDTYYVDHQMRLDEFNEYYSNVDYHISNRMHSLLVGYKYGSLPIALIDSQKHVKIAATIEDCNIQELMIDIYQPLNENQLTQIVKNRESFLEKLYGCEQEKQQELRNVLGEFFS